MKKFLIILSVAATAFSLTAAHAGAVPTWAESYGLGAYLNTGKHADSQFSGSGDDYPVGIAKMPDGGVVVAGQLSFPKDARDSVPTYTTGLVRFGADGSISWQRVLSLPQTTGTAPTFYRAPVTVSQVVADTQGNIFVAVSKGTPGSGAQVASVAKFSAAGALLWENGIRAAATKEGNPAQTTEYGVSPFTTMSLTPDGGVLVGASQGMSTPFVGDRPVMAKFNSDGSLAMYAAFNFSQAALGHEGYAIQYFPASAVGVSKDGSKYVMLLQYPVAASVNPDSRGLSAVVTDTAGNLVGVHTFPPNDGRRENPISIIATSDGGFATLSQITGDFGPNGGFCLRRFNSDLSVETFEKVVKNATSADRLTGMSLAEAADGTLVVGGHTNNGFEDAMIMKFNASGSPEFCSLLGGPRQDGGPSKQYAPDTGAYLAVMPDGGYAFAAATLSYGVDTQLKYTNWWVVRTDPSRKVRGFTDTMGEKALNAFAVIDTTRPPDNTQYFFRVAPETVAPVVTDLPRFNVFDPGTFEAPNQPELLIQASSPRIVSATAAEAIVQQHFAYHTLTAFFPDPSKVTFSAEGLPPEFTLDPHTGIISAVPSVGTETTTPIAITLHATDGVDTANAVLRLTIGDGVPRLTVNGSDQPTAGVVDSILTFLANYPGKRAGRTLTIESAGSPQGPWTGLDTGLGGAMSYDYASARYILASTNYPQESGVFFRVHVRTKGFPNADLFSNIVGPFDLGSAKPRAGKTVFRIKRNGLRADFDFRVTELNGAPGVRLRVQTSKAPSVEGSWTDVPGGATMSQDGDGIHYALLRKTIEEGSGIYFRAIASGPVENPNSVVDSVSNIIGSYTVEAAKPPTVQITSPAIGGGGAGQTFENPLQITMDANGVATINIKATATAGPGRSISKFSILLDGNPIYTITSGAASASIDYQKSINVSADHVIEALALDNKRGTARAGTGPVYLRVVPPATGVALKTPGSESATATSVTGKVYHVVKNGGLWDEPTTWQDSAGVNGVPGKYDFAVIGNATVQFVDKNVGQPNVVGSVSISGGHFVGETALDVFGTFTIAGGTCDRVGLTIHQGAVLDVVANTDVQLGFIINSGTWKMRGAGGVTANHPYINHGTLVWQIPLLRTAAEAALFPPNRGSIAGSVLHDYGTVLVQSLVTDNGAGILTNTSANLSGQPGAHIISQDGGSLISQDGGSIVSDNGLGIVTDNGSGIISPDGNSLINQDGASLINQDGASLINQDGASYKLASNGALRSPTGQEATAESGYIKEGGELDLTNVAIIGPLTVNAGVIEGSGLVIGDLTNNGGYVAPGHSPGLIAVTGNFTQAANGTSVIEMANAEPGQFDQLQIGGAANLGGKLELKTINGYLPLPNDSINPFTANSVTGSFNSVSSNGQASANSTGVSITVDPSKPNPSSGKPLNIATRLAIQSGDNALFAGFIVTGANGTTKKVMIRGIGPSLANFGVAGTISDPLLELHKPDGSVVVNDNWQQGDTTQIPGGFSPSDPRESVIVATLAPGNYSAVVKGAHGETGVGLAEVYDLQPGTGADLANIATRGFVQTGDNVLIGGFIVGGTEPAKILIRAISPSLAAFGVPNTLAATTLELHDSNGSVINNEGWRNTQEAEIIATTIPPSNDNESAILATLVPGNYTAVVRGKNDTTGIAVVEAYNLQ